MGQRDGLLLGGRGDRVVGEGGRGVDEAAAGWGCDGRGGQSAVLCVEIRGVRIEGGGSAFFLEGLS